MSDVQTVTDPAALSRERDVEQAAARRGYLNGIEDAMRVIRRLGDRHDDWLTRGLTEDIIRELTAVMNGREVRP